MIRWLKVTWNIWALDHRTGGPLRRAIDALGDLGSPRAVKPLLATYQKFLNNEFVRHDAAIALGKLGDPAAIEPLIFEMGSKDICSRVGRDETAKLLASFRDVRVVEALISALDDKDGTVRCLAAQGLAQLGDARAVSRLISSLGDTGHASYGAYVRVEAAQALEVLGEPQWSPLIKGCEMGYPGCIDVAERDFERLAAVNDPRAVEPLIYALKNGRLSDGDASFQFAAARLLGKRGDKRAIPALRAALKSETFDRLRNAIIEALALLESPKS